MNLRGTYIIPAVLGLLLVTATAAAKSDLATPEKRRESIEQAMALVRPVVPAPLPADLKNPFVMSREVGGGGAVVKQLAGDRQVLAAVAPHIVPSGVVTQVDGTPMLLLGEKKLKVGEYLTITFEGTQYMVELSAISHSSFTLRLNKEEVTQPINP
jgi:hypothetical protein